MRWQSTDYDTLRTRSGRGDRLTPAERDRLDRYTQIQLNRIRANSEAWRQSTDSEPVTSGRYWSGLAATAERGLLDFVTFDDGLSPQRRRRPGIEPRWLAGRPDAVLVASRVAPDADSRRIARIPFNARGIKNYGCPSHVTFEQWKRMTEVQKDRAARSRWCEVEYKGQKGWVAGRFLKEDGR